MTMHAALHLLSLHDDNKQTDPQLQLFSCQGCQAAGGGAPEASAVSLSALRNPSRAAASLNCSDHRTTRRPSVS